MRRNTRTNLILQLAQEAGPSSNDRRDIEHDNGYESSPPPSLDVSFDLDDSLEDPPYFPSDISDQNSELGSDTAEVNSNENLLLPFTMTKESQIYTDSSKIDRIVVGSEKESNLLEPQIYSEPETDKIGNVRLAKARDILEPQFCTDSYEIDKTGDVGLEKLSDTLVIKENNESYVKSSSTSQSWNKRKKKRTTCKYCLSEVTNFERHLERNHTDCEDVRDMLSYPKKHSERKKIIGLIRNDGHFTEFLKGNIQPKYDFNTENKEYYPCCRCKALLSKKYLSRHKKRCILKSISNADSALNQLAASQTLIACSLDQKNTIHKLRVREEVFSKMKSDEISMVAKTDRLICYFGENYLKKHKREQITSVCSNKMRELARFLIEFRKLSNNSNLSLKDLLKPKIFDLVIECAKKLGGYNADTKSYRSPSLSAHIGTSLKQVCDLFIRLILKEDPSFISENKESILKNTKRFKELIDSQWTTEVSSLAFKDLQEKQWEKPVLLPLTRDVTKFKEYVTNIAHKAVVALEKNPNNKKELKYLIEASLTLTILFNRKRIGDVQYTKLTTYTESINSTNQEECERALTESEKVLTKYYKRVVTGGKGSRPVAILFPVHLQSFIDFSIRIRLETHLVSQNNPYLFGCPGTTKWTRGDVVIRKFAKEANLEFPQYISSNKLRKQIATVMQILNLNRVETEQFAQFMGHTEKTHNEFYKLPQDVYQTAKISKLLLLMERGVDTYKGKSLMEIDIDPQNEVAEEESHDEDYCENVKLIAPQGKHQKQNMKTEKNKITGRTPWTDEQANLVKSHFKENINIRKPPKKDECLELIRRYPDIFHNKDWLRVKTFVYNIYRNK